MMARRPQSGGRLRDERGLTLVELMVSTLVGTLVLLAAYALLDSTISSTARTTDRTHALQEARLALELMTRQLRSQVCPEPGGESVAAGGDRSVTFYADLGTNRIPDRHRVTLDPTTRTIVQEVWKPTTPVGPPWSYPASPTSTTQLAEEVEPLEDVPVFRYYAFTDSEPYEPTVLLPADPALSDTDRARVVRIAIAFKAVGERGDADELGELELENEVFFRAANEFAGTPPVCA